MSKSKKSLTDPRAAKAQPVAKEYDYRVTLAPDTLTPEWWVEVYTKGVWRAVKLFWTEKEAENWLKGGNPFFSEFKIMLAAKIFGTTFVWTIVSALYMFLMEKDPTVLRTAIVLGPTVLAALFAIWS